MCDRDFNHFFTKIKSELKSLRRKLHQYPEVGWTEYYTTYVIVEELADLGFTLTVGKDVLVSEKRMGVPEDQVLTNAEERARELGVPENYIEKMSGGHTGLVAEFDSGIEGPHVAFRFDIDALPIKEADTNDHLPASDNFTSKNFGQMHACAHDGHTTIGIGLAKWISEMKDELTGKITLLFQPAEEGSRGALSMVEKGWLDDVDHFLTGHIGIQHLQVGDIAATTTGFLATSKINVQFRGKSAHAGVEPQEGKNALLAASAAAVHLHAIPRHSNGATRINVGKMEAGSGRNIIADFGRLELETRGETTELNEYMANEAIRIIESVATMHDVEVEIERVGEGINVECDPEWIDVVENACHESESITRVIPKASLGGSEDATYMIRRVQECGGKATYMLFGTPLPAGHHHPKFDYDEDVLGIGVETYARLLWHLAKK
ncbi:amidohydrolase [Bacillus shivajii]|uniref:amidohydrolase n=1 Tax=Bacillus shivajii TaxID=1983719 RepID=UPI001CF9DA8C|nr:amidohydrolase [Bacillus shivajii]UCZ52740.1 amidohydrolase [Bacillus shivajii]